MNKDADERVVSTGEYRDALNIEITTSEASNVGTAQTILGNRQITSMIDTNNELCYTVGHIVDEKVDRIIRFVATPAPENNGLGIDRIMEYNTDITVVATEIPIVVDIYAVDTGTSSSGVGVSSLVLTGTNKNRVRVGMSVAVETNAGIPITGYSFADEIIIKTYNGITDTITLGYKNGATFSAAGTISITDIVHLKAPRVLKFDDPTSGFVSVPKKVSITGINVMDDLLFWTDNYSEPKKIHIPRSKLGTVDALTHTDLVVKDISVALQNNYKRSS